MWLLLLGCPPEPEDSVGESTPQESLESVPDTELPPTDTENIGDSPALWTLSHDSSLLYEGITFEAATPYALDVVYSTDGRAPSLEWTGSLTVETTTVLRLELRKGEEVVESATRSFIFPAQIADQKAPADYPTQWWVEDDQGPFPADYEMDPKVMENFAVWFPEAWELIPSLSIVIPPEELFSTETGIHENAVDSGPDWERAVNATLLNAGDANFNIDCGMRAQGRSSRFPERSNKKSFRLLFKKDYGPGKLRTQVFPGNEVEEYDGFVLRARYNRSWAHFTHVQRERAMYMRERYAMELMDAMGHSSSATRHAHLFLNGLYWGLYLLEERPDAHYMANRTGSQSSDWDIINSGNPQDGDLQSWEDLLEMGRAGLQDDADWDAFAAEIDVENFVDYTLLQLYLGNIDWPEANWYTTRRHDRSNVWQFFMWDAELTMVNTTDNLLGTATDSGTPGELFQLARENAGFRALFNERAHLHLDEGGALHWENMLAAWEALGAEVKPVVAAESARWGDHWRDDRADPEAVLYTLGHWKTENDRITGYYLEHRHPRFINTLREADLWLD
jgi:hypothetical protein